MLLFMMREKQSSGLLEVGFFDDMVATKNTIRPVSADGHRDFS